MSRVLENLDPLERALVGKGFPAMSPWWRAQVVRFYEAGRRQLVLRVGRRGGKSSTLCRVAVLESLFGDHKVPPGDLGVVAFISVSRDEANQRLRTIKAILDALGVRYRPIENGVELEGAPIGFKTYVATVAGVSGFTAIAILCDETAKWRDADTGANPAREVLASLRPTMATQPNARMFLSSSPLGRLDAHAEAFEQGETARQLTAYATTWEANPSITEEQTRLDEPNERVWLREYKAIPQGDLTSVFDLADIDRAMEQRPAEVTLVEEHERVLVIDASRGGDKWTYDIARYVVEETPVDEENAPRAPSGKPWCFAVAPKEERGWDAEAQAFKIISRKRQDVGGAWWDFDPGVYGASQRTVLEVEEVGEVPNARDTEAAVMFLGTLARRLRPRGFGQDRVRKVLHDQYEAGAMRVLLRRAGLWPIEQTWSNTTKSRAVDRLDRLLRSRSIRFPAHDVLRRQLSEYSEKITRTGALTYAGSGRHDDYAQVIVTTAMGDVSGALQGSPTGISRLRHEID